MPVQDQYLAYILEQLGALGSLRSNRMFGGIGLYSREIFFGLIDDDTLFFKTDESNAAEYQARRMPRFMPPANRPLGPMGYHQVPAEIIEDGESLVAWARKALAVALSAQAKNARKPRRVKSAAMPVRKKAAGKKAAMRKRARAKPRKKR